MDTPPDPRRQSSPEIEPPPGSPPKRFPEHPAPLASGKKEAKPGDPENPSTHLGSGEDPNVESGVDKNDPEQQASSGDDVEKSFE